MARSTVLKAKVIPWEPDDGLWGVSLTHKSGREKSYMVGNRAEAEKEVKDLLRPTRIKLVKSDG